MHISNLGKQVYLNFGFLAQRVLPKKGPQYFGHFVNLVLCELVTFKPQAMLKDMVQIKKWCQPQSNSAHLDRKYTQDKYHVPNHCLPNMHNTSIYYYKLFQQLLHLLQLLRLLPSILHGFLILGFVHSFHLQPHLYNQVWLQQQDQLKI